MSRKRLAVAMSGGVDSSVAAAILKEAGYEVSGIHLKLWADPNYESNVSILEQTCKSLDIPLHKLNLEAEFQSLVIDFFCQEYSLGQTPNPCTVCNQRIKFGLLLRRVLEIDADYLATGHYARVEYSPDGYRLLKATDVAKDQSYFLYTLGQSQLQHVILPLANLRKVEVKRLAAEIGLTTSSQRESQNVCFIPDNDYRAFIAKHIILEPGDIVDISGKLLGKHDGLAFYTIGQRHRLGLSSSERLYVLRLDANSNRLVVGSKDELLGARLTANKLSWVSGRPPRNLSNITAKIRYGSPEAAVKLYIHDGRAKVEFLKPQNAITPGQAIVFYQGDTVLGGGIIEARID